MDWLHTWTERWSDLWVMLASVGTLIAVGVAIWSVRRESKAREAADARAEKADQARLEEMERSAEERGRHVENERLAQARQMIAWVEHRQADPARPHFDQSGERQLKQEHVLCCVNHSDAPVFQVALYVYWRTMRTSDLISEVAVVPGGARAEFILPDEFQPNGVDATGMVMFRDLRGLYWRRWENGYLNEMDENGREKAAPIIL